MVENNADKVEKGYIYIWNIDRSNYKEKIPTLKLYTKKHVFNYENEFVIRVLTVIGIIAIIGGVGYYYYNHKNK